MNWMPSDSIDLNNDLYLPQDEIGIKGHISIVYTQALEGVGLQLAVIYVNRARNPHGIIMIGHLSKCPLCHARTRSYVLAGWLAGWLDGWIGGGWQHDIYNDVYLSMSVYEV